MGKYIIIFILISCCVYSQELVKNKSHIISQTLNIEKNKRTTITLINSDSTQKFILFDNILEEPQAIIFIHQPYYFQERDKICDKIVMPFPIITPGMYYINYVTSDTVYTKKFVYLK
jgi:hypothetical protein